jgi:hypothetical protein
VLGVAAGRTGRPVFGQLHLIFRRCRAGAEVDYRSNGSRPVWYVAIGAGADVVFSEMFGDDC